MSLALMYYGVDTSGQHVVVDWLISWTKLIETIVPYNMVLHWIYGYQSSVLKPSFPRISGRVSSLKHGYVGHMLTWIEIISAKGKASCDPRIHSMTCLAWATWAMRLGFELRLLEGDRTDLMLWSTTADPPNSSTIASHHAAYELQCVNFTLWHTK